jgi:hypothetical protein
MNRTISFFKPSGIPIIKKELNIQPLFYRLCISLIADRLLFSRACFLLGLVIKIKIVLVNNTNNVTER